MQKFAHTCLENSRYLQKKNLKSLQPEFYLKLRTLKPKHNEDEIKIILVPSF